MNQVSSLIKGAKKGLMGMLLVAAASSTVVTLSGCGESTTAVEEAKILSEGSIEYYTNLCKGKTADQIIEMFGVPDDTDYIGNGTSGKTYLRYRRNFQILGEYGQKYNLKIVVDQETKMFIEVVS